MPFTSMTSSLMPSNPVDSAKPPSTKRLIKIPSDFTAPCGVTLTEKPIIIYFICII